MNSQSKERIGYPTQKPEALLQRIIECASNEGDIVLDPFTIINKSGKQTHTFSAGVHVVAVKVVDNDGLESVETIKLKVNGVVEKM